MTESRSCYDALRDRVPDEVREHLDTARAELRKGLETFLPPEFFTTGTRPARDAAGLARRARCGDPADGREGRAGLSRGWRAVAPPLPSPAPTRTPRPARRRPPTKSPTPAPTSPAATRTDAGDQEPGGDHGAGEPVDGAAESSAPPGRRARHGPAARCSRPGTSTRLVCPGRARPPATRHRSGRSSGPAPELVSSSTRRRAYGPTCCPEVDVRVEPRAHARQDRHRPHDVDEVLRDLEGHVQEQVTVLVGELTHLLGVDAAQLAHRQSPVPVEHVRLGLLDRGDVGPRQQHVEHLIGLDHAGGVPRAHRDEQLPQAAAHGVGDPRDHAEVHERQPPGRPARRPPGRG